MHGQGVCIFSNGDTHAGFFEIGTQHGQGTYMFTDGSVVSGDWRNGNPSHGTYVDTGGRKSDSTSTEFDTPINRLRGVTSLRLA